MNARDPSPPSAHVPPQTVAPDRDRRVSPWWRALAILLLLVLLLGWAASASMFEQFKAQLRHQQGQLSGQAQITQVAVLVDAQGRPAMLATFTERTGRLQLQRLNDVKEGREDSLQVWALDASGRARSLGIIESRHKTLQMPVLPGDLPSAVELGISAENKGGVPDGASPSLPWLFRGWLVHKAI
ncbi:MAG: anti-sigma factor domain-containing protein [Hydrogenophaga sp.]